MSDEGQLEFLGLDEYQRRAGATDTIVDVVEDVVVYPVRHLLDDAPEDMDARLATPAMAVALSHHTLGLVSEAGEVAGKVKKLMRDNRGVMTREIRDNIKAELGDTLWYLSRVSALLEIDLSDVAATNLQKLQSRAERGLIQGDGDER